ncbi:MAG: hypothetical protein NTV94_11875 [Planctomycetota bacterium]|nr:hypothetical protein [Planctomycetota bacterium]
MSDPAGANGCVGGSATFTVGVSGSGPFSYQWRANGLEIDPGLNPSAAMQTLTLNGLNGLDAASYDCVIDNACGSVTSGGAVLSICVADINCDGGVDLRDVEAFFAVWEAGEPLGDVNVDGGVDYADVEAFFARWEGGC